MSTILPSNATVNITGGYTYIQWVQEASGNTFIPAILFAVFIILFVVLKGNYVTNAKAFAGTSFITTVMAIMLSVMHLLSPTYMYMAIIILAIAGVWLYVEGKVE